MDTNTKLTTVAPQPFDPNVPAASRTVETVPATDKPAGKTAAAPVADKPTPTPKPQKN